jgi:tetratricopeptide (TPR) repeat protein
MPQRILECLERLLAQELEGAPEVVDLRTVRSEHGGLMERYEEQARAIQSLGLALPGDFHAKVVRAADRWRAIDPDNDEPCCVAGRIFQTIGSRAEAWDYLTTPVGRRPNEPGPWADLAASLARQGSLDLAENAYADACESDPTNAELLWARARNLTQSGRFEGATKLYRRIAAGPWPPKYRGLQEQARLRLAGP